MFRKIIFCCAAIAISISAQAGIAKSATPKKMTNGLFAATKVNKQMLAKERTLKDNEMWWGYYNGIDSLGLLGTSVAERYDCGFYIPGTTSTLLGANISAIRFYLADVNVLKDVKVWMTRQLPTDDKYDAIVQDVPNPVSLVDGDNFVELTTPYMFTNEGVYVGISYTVTDASGVYGQMPMVTAAAQKANSAWFRTSESITNWSDGTGFGFNEFAIQAVVSGGNLKQNAMYVEPVGESLRMTNSDMPINLTYLNVGTDGVKSFDYTYGMAGNEKSVHVDLKEPIGKVYGVGGTIPLTITTSKEPGYLKANLKITKVNGVNNETPELGSREVPIINISKSAPRKSVMETFTATWSKWSPRSIVGMNILKKKYGADFIAIEAHNTDPMTAPTYANVVDYAPDIPICYIDRTAIVDPYFGDREADAKGAFHFSDSIFNIAHKIPSEIELNLTAKWNDESRTKIEATSTLDYYYSRPDNPYRIAYVLVEDSLHGDGLNWAQLNAYHQNAEKFPDEDMKEFVNAPDTIYNMRFNNVAQGIWDAFGIEGALGSSFEKDVPQTHNFEIDLASMAPNIQNKDNLKLIAMVVNYNNDCVINAQEVKIGTTSGINNADIANALTATVTKMNDNLRVTVNNGEAVNADIYTSNGVLLTSKTFRGSADFNVNGYKGVCIVRVYNKNGVSVRKVSL
jgi:hypothetical protein